MIDLTETNSIERIADWVELKVIYNYKPISKSTISSYLRKHNDDLNEEFVDSIISELIRRKTLYGSCSPYKVVGKLIKPIAKWQDVPELTMCLVFSIRGVEKIKGKDDGTKLFELLSREAAKKYLGGEAEVIGFPNELKLSQQIGEIARKTCEKQGSRRPKPKDKDKGVDIIAWKSHGDTRPNQLILLLQCGAGKHVSEKQQISETAWHEFFNLSAKAITGIMIPVVPDAESWIEIRDIHNMIFDRVRICRAIYGGEERNKPLQKKIISWCKAALN
jgi:hypothetical protein